MRRFFVSVIIDVDESTLAETKRYSGGEAGVQRFKNDLKRAAHDTMAKTVPAANVHGAIAEETK